MSIRTMAAHPLEATPRSNSYVTIQMRRGLESQMDKSKFLPAEFGATTDTKKLFFAFGAGDVQQLATYQNMEGLMAQSLAGLEKEYLGSITQATQNAINATSRANSATTAANQAAEEANQAAAKLTPEAIFSAVETYFTEHPVDLDCTPTLEGKTLVFPSGADASGTLTQAVQDLLAFMNKFNGKTLYEEVV